MSARAGLRRLLLGFVLFAAPAACELPADEPANARQDPKTFRAGAAAVDITPQTFPVVVNGMFHERKADRAHDRLMARTLVLDDGTTRLAIVIVDNLMMPRDLLDEAKQMAHQATGLPTDRMLIAATHTHSAPSVMGCLGSGVDVEYRQWLPGQLAKSIVLASENLVRARVGWAVVEDHEHNHCRRWIFRPDRVQTDPFGERTVRAHMHPGHESADHIGPAGPADPDLSLLAVQTADGQPLAVLGNYAMHYYGSEPLSGDFCGRFGDKFASLIGADRGDSPFVGMMSQGTSGDSMWPDYSRPAPRRDLDAYTEAVARVAQQAYEKVEYRDWVPLAMAETTLKLRRRVPDDERLAWARSVTAELDGRPPQGMAEIYAREQVYLAEEPEVELTLQAVRIGELGITAIPNEVYGITGLKLKARSPLPVTFNITLAGGAQGYIPPPQQHVLGGYTTWPARTAGLEVQAEPQIVSALLRLLEKVADSPQREAAEPRGDYVEAVLNSQPAAYWRLDELDGTQAIDAMGQSHGSYEPGVAFYLPGPAGAGFSASKRGNRAAHFAGGRLAAHVDDLGDDYSVEFFFWNGLPHDARPVTGYMFSRGTDAAEDAPGDHLGIGGTYREDLTGKLIFFNGNEKNQVLVGKTELDLRTWYHVVFTREGREIRVYLNGNSQPEISGQAARTFADGVDQLFLGGRNDNLFNFEGMLDEVAVYDRVLTAPEVAAHFRAWGVPAAAAAEDVSAVQPDPPPSSPAESLAMVHVSDGFEVELVAAEPLVMDPVAIDWGPDGKLWVVEMADYPSGMDGDGQPGGRVRYLEDTNGDGQYDRSTLFLEGLPFPTGILAWNDGVLITAAPEILYAADTNGDGKADVRKPLFTGFFEGNQQLRVNGLRWGLDNWIYCASGAHHGGYGSQTEIRVVETGDLVPLGSRDFRIRPEAAALDPLAGPSQFGRDRDDWGNWFGVQNSHPLWHVVLEDRYTRRNPHAAPPDPRNQLLPRNPRVFSAKPPELRFHSFEESGHFTSACSAMIYRDELLFDRDERQHAFTCEPFHNLVHRAVITEQGVSFTARRADEEQESEFFASEDHWCRPVMVRTGPDGALWVVDMYRYMIEHPEWLPPEGREALKPFYRSGDDRGRIYRVYPAGKQPRAIPQLDTLDTQQLIAMLESPNGWQRDTAQQLLIAQKDPTAVGPLVRLAETGSEPLARLHALCTLDGLDELQPDLIQRSLEDPHPAVRRHAVRLAEPRVAADPDGPASQLVAAVLELTGDPDAKVRLQVACTLGEWQDPSVGRGLAEIALAEPRDPYLVAAVLSSVNETNIGPMLQHVLVARHEDDSSELVGRLLAQAIAAGQNQPVAAAISQLAEGEPEEFRPWQFVALAEVLDAADRHDVTLESFVDRETGRLLEDIISTARSLVADPQADEQLRRVALRLLGRQADRRDEDLEALGGLLVPQTLASVQQAAVRQLARQPGREVAEQLLDGWKSHGPELRGQILTVLSGRQSWVEVLVENLESGQVLAAELDAATRQRLADQQQDADLRARLDAQLALTSSEDRQEVLERYRSATKLPGDPERGAEVFARNCAVCHKLGDVGHEVGPNLLSLTDRSPERLLNAVLDPNQAVEPSYLNYVAFTVDGRSYSGILGSETGNSITLIGPEGERVVLLRNELEALQSTGKSLMPEGLEQELSPQDLADLMQFISASGQE